MNPKNNQGPFFSCGIIPGEYICHLLLFLTVIWVIDLMGYMPYTVVKKGE